ncbi:MAG: GNAT family N-acetyltransferase [Acidimicrobiales bacterium]
MQNASGATSSESVIRAMTTDDLDQADRVMRTAFGTFLGVPDPSVTFGDAEIIRPRFSASPDGAFVASRNGEVLGSVLATRWGSFGFFGPLTVREDVWNQGLARRLLVPVMALFDEWGVALTGLHTFAQSAKHVGLYQRFGYWPQYLTALMAKPVEESSRSDNTTRLSTLAPPERATAVDACAQLTDSIYDGLEVNVELEEIALTRLGDVVLVTDDTGVAAFAVCHCGDGEAGSSSCFVKFAAVRPGPTASRHFTELLAGVEAFSRERAVAQVTLGMNTSHRRAYAQLLELGYRSAAQGVRMQRPDDLGYCRDDVYVIDDLR